jgi:DNA-binding CsgD family transcriptional regulator
MRGLDVIAAALRLARSGAGSLVVLRGPLGCGRSATLQDARRLAERRGVRVLRATAARQERDFPYGVVHQLAGEECCDPPRPSALHDVLVAAGPALVTVDDLQWADEESLGALAHSADRLAGIPALLVVAVRDGDVWSGSPRVERVVRRAARVVELERPLLMAGSRQKLAACLRAQPPQVRAVLDAMAVLGDAGVELIALLAEVDEIGCATALRAMGGLGLVDPQAPGFVHRVVREAVEETMAPAVRVRLESRAVRLLHDVGRPAEEIADRLLDITSGQELWAVEVLRTAAASALERGACTTAVEYLRRALLEEPRPGRKRATLLVELAAAMRGIDRLGAMNHLTAAVGMVSGTRERAAIAARFMPGALVDGPAPVRDLTERIASDLRAARPHDDDVLRDLALRVEARSHYAECMAPDGFVRCVDRLGEVPGEVLPATGATRELLSAQLHCATIASAWRAGDVAAVARRVLAHEPPRPGHVHTPIATLVTTFCATDSVDAVSVWLDSARERAVAANATAEQVLIEAEQALVLLHRGRITAALGSAARILDEVGPCRDLGSQVLLTLCSIAWETQDGRLVDRLVPLMGERTRNPALSAAYRMLCGAASAVAMDLHAGLAHLMDAGNQFTRLGWRNPVLFPWRAAAASLLCRLGDVAAARKLATEQHTLAVAWGSAAGVGKALRHLGSMTEGDAGVALVRQAVGVLEGSANRFELAKALWQLGTRTGDRDCLEHSWTVAGECGEGTLLAWVESVAGEVADGFGLTEAQQRAVGLAAAGRSNQEIAEQLRVGVRMVEKHLTNAYRKLGVQGRNGLPAVLSAADLSPVRPYRSSGCGTTSRGSGRCGTTKLACSRGSSLTCQKKGQ